MNTPATARRGNQFSVAGMAIAVVTTLALIIHAGVISATGWIVMLAGVLIGLTAHNAVGYILAFVAAFFAAANVVGGYVVTGRMLKMFRRKAAPAPAPAEVQPQEQESVRS